jgi:hypothetical protein
MQALAILALVAVLFGLLAWAAGRAGEVFRLSIRYGRCLMVRGRLPATLRHELCAIASEAKVKRGRLRGIRRGGQTQLVAEGLPDGAAQRARNVFGLHRGPELRAGGQPDDPNLGQRLGWDWLAWKLAGEPARHGRS